MFVFRLEMHIHPIYFFNISNGFIVKYTQLEEITRQYYLPQLNSLGNTAKKKKRVRDNVAVISDRHDSSNKEKQIKPIKMNHASSIIIWYLVENFTKKLEENKLAWIEKTRIKKRQAQVTREKEAGEGGDCCGGGGVQIQFYRRL